MMETKYISNRYIYWPVKESGFTHQICANFHYLDAVWCDENKFKICSPRVLPMRNTQVLYSGVTVMRGNIVKQEKEVMDRRKFLNGVAGTVGSVGVIAATVPFIEAMEPSARTLQLGGPVNVDISRIEPGEQITVKWRGMPVFILKRTPEMQRNLKLGRENLRDPDSKVDSQQPAYAQNSTRSIKPENFVCIGLCTHLGCVPTFRPDIAPPDLGPEWHGGYFCPCHGSRFDLAGRVVKDVPAPLNLVIPPHRYVTDTTIVIGEDNG